MIPILDHVMLVFDREVFFHSRMLTPFQLPGIPQDRLCIYPHQENDSRILLRCRIDVRHLPFHELFRSGVSVLFEKLLLSEKNLSPEQTHTLEAHGVPPSPTNQNKC